MMGFIFLLMNWQLDLLSMDKQRQIDDLYKRLSAEYASRFIEVDSSDQNDFLGYLQLQDYCRDISLSCRGPTGDWSWNIQLVDTPLYRYRVIRVLDGNGRQLFSVSGEPIWSGYLRKVDAAVGIFCSNLYDYMKIMSEKAAADLNWYAITESGCYYDAGVNSVSLGGVSITKEIRCSDAVSSSADGWAAVSAANATVVGGVFRLDTGEIEIKNTNSIYTGECAYAGLTGTQPPYAVAVRVKIQEGRYFEVCCGF